MRASRNRGVLHITADYIEAASTLSINICKASTGTSAQSWGCPSRVTIEIDQLRDLCEELLTEANNSIWLNEFFDSGERFDGAYDDLIAAGAHACEILLEEDARKFIWSSLHEVDRAVILSNVREIPWELLYLGDAKQGCFLGSSSIITFQNWQKSHDDGQHRRKKPLPSNKLPHLLVDPVIFDSGDFLFQGGSIQKFVAEAGMNYEISTVANNMMGTVNEKRFIHWICEHCADKGLRLSEDAYFSSKHAKAFRVDPSTILILSACGAAMPASTVYGAKSLEEKPFVATAMERASVAEIMEEKSGCTIIAAATLVSAPLLVSFMRRLSKLIEFRSDGISLDELWAEALGLVDKKVIARRLTTDELPFLFYRVHGSLNHRFG